MDAHNIITEPAVKAWLHEQRRSFGIPNLQLKFWSGFVDDNGFDCVATVGNETAFGPTIAEAVTAVKAKIKTPEQEAAELRAEAQRLIEKAARIHPVAA